MSPTTASSLLPLPATTYTPPSANRSKASTLEQNVASVRANGIARDGSPGPHDFYRRPQEDNRIQRGLGYHREGLELGFTTILHFLRELTRFRPPRGAHTCRFAVIAMQA